jgi:outer membrane biosynthesis protein TonB
MLTNGFRKFSFLAGTGILAACLWILTGTTASAQSSGDGDLQAAVASALTHDPMLKNQPVTAYTANGVVTLTGSVETEQQRQEAETVAANVQGVSGIQNNITVAGSDSSQAQTAPPPPADAQQTPPPPPADTQQPAAAPESQQIPPPPPPDEPAQPAQPAAPRAPYAPYPQRGYGQPYPPQQTSGPVTIPAGTLLQIRISEPLDIAKLQDGAAFQATAASDVFEGNVLAIPRGAVLQGTVVKVKKPGALGGSGELQLQITGVNLSGNSYPVVSDIWSNRSPNKAGYTASNTAGGAVVGAIIGGILGRGPGAAIGAAVGGGAGLAASAGTNGPRLYLPPESLLNFHLTSAVTVQPVSWQEAQRLAQSVPQLQRRPVYMAPPYPYGYPYPYRVYGW